MVSGLDAVRTFMEIPKTALPSGFGIVFVISCDEERIAEALADRRRQRSSDLPGAVMDPTDARRFLDRIFQFRLEIPQFPKRDMRNYAMRRLTQDLPLITKDLLDRGVSLETLIDRMIHVDVQSPRNAIQILNAFAEAWWIACQRELEGVGTDKPGGLHEGAVTNHPLSLSAISVLKVDFPRFYEDLQKEPDLIKRFTEVFVDGKPLENQPEAIKLVLETYAANGKLKSQYRPLRQFITGIQGIRWPVSLQPLLVLSEDPITRKFGDKAPKLYDAFVSGDHSGVLAELGRDADAKPLSDEDVRLLHDMQEELRHETEARRDNAARVIAALADRLPAMRAHLLVSPLARRLAQSRALRSFIGVHRIEGLLPKAQPEDRQEVAARLIEDLLRSDEENIELTLPSGEEPSLDEAVDMVRVTCELVLTIRGEDGLDVQHDQMLLDWLQTRGVSIREHKYEFPFSEFESWMATHEGHLLSSLGERYTNLVIAQLEADETEDIEVSAMLRRVRIVFEQLWTLGEASRADLWAQLNRLAAVHDRIAVSLAWETMTAHSNAPDPTAITLFVKNMAGRLLKAMDDEAWALDWEAGGRAFLNLVEARTTDVQNSAFPSINNLIISWSRNTDTANFAVSLLNWFRKKDTASANEVIDDWSAQVIIELADEGVVWLAREFQSFSSAQQQKITASLAPVHQRTNISEKESQSFAGFMRHLSDEALKSTVVQDFLEELYPYLQAQYGNPNEYLYRIFPPLPRILHLGPGAEVGTMLQDLFANARTDLTIYAWLHDQMKGSWPEATSETGPYDPSQIFESLIQSIRENPADTNAPKLLDAATAMVNDGVAESSKESNVLEAASCIWPHHQSKALSIFESSEQLPRIVDITALMDGVDYENAESRANLERAWSHFASQLSIDQVTEIAKLILGKKPKGYTEEPDAAFRIWFDVHGDRRSEFLRMLITDDSLSDAQHRRVWSQIERLALKLGKDFFLAALPKIFATPDSAETTSGVFESEAIISDLFKTASDKYKLGSSILDSFLGSSSMETKNRLAQWLRNIDQTSVLKDLKGKENISDEDVGILITNFPNTKVLKQLQESRKKAEDASTVGSE